MIPEDASTLTKLLFLAAALVLPILWGVLVNWAFEFWTGEDDPAADSIFPDYQI